MRLSRRRKILLFLLACIVSIALATGLLPVWLPWALPRIAAHFDATYSKYERVGYDRLILNEVQFEKDQIRFEARKIETFIPTVWLWKKVFATKNSAVIFCSANDWRLTKRAGKQSKPLYASLGKAERNLANVGKWIPYARLENGSIDWKGTEIDVPTGEWINGKLNGKVFIHRLKQNATVRAEINPKFPWNISVETIPAALKLALTIDRDSNLATIAGNLSWHDNRADFSAEFVPEKKLPQLAQLESKSFRIPANDLRLPGYGDLTGSIMARWENGRGTIDLNAAAQPATSAEQWPPLTAILHAAVDTNSIQIETGRISAPWLRAEVSKNFQMTFGGQLLSDAASFQLTADLSKQPWLPLTGVLDGEAVLRRSTNRFPDIAFTLAGANLRGFKMDAKEVGAEVNLVWPTLKVNRFNIQFGDGSFAQAAADLDLQAQEIKKATFKIAGAFAKSLMPEGFDYKTLSLNADVSGPWKKPQHSVEVQITELALPKLVPLNVAARWRGNFLQIEDFNADISPNKNAALKLSGSANLATNHFQILLKSLDLRNAAEKFALEQPVKVFLQQKKDRANWRLAVEPLHWRNQKSDLVLSGDIDYPFEGQLTLTARQISPIVLQPFLRKPLPPVLISDLKTSAQWSRGPVEFTIALATRFSPEKVFATNLPALPFLGHVQVSGSARGLSLDKIILADSSATVLSGSGFLPITLDPTRGKNFLQINSKQPLQFTAGTEANPHFWKELTHHTRFSLVEPMVRIAVAGTFEAPKGNITLALERADAKIKTNLPPVTLRKLSAAINLTRHQIDLKTFQVLLEGQPIRATGQLPLPEFEGGWKNILDWKRAHGRLQMEEVQFAALSKFAPSILSPQGKVNLNLLLHAGGKLDGELTLVDGATRPLPQLGALQNVDARLKFNGKEIEIERCTGLIGGGPVAVFGKVNLFESTFSSLHEERVGRGSRRGVASSPQPSPPMEERGSVPRSFSAAEKESRNWLPRFDITIRGDSVPLSRRSDLILRTGFDLRISNTQPGEPKISGTATLQNSYFLSDLRLLVPARVARPKNRPPFFSIEAEPFANWLLDVKIRGREFLKVRSPFFTGKASANLHLIGTLREPMALGDVIINSGVIEFPFANLDVGQGDVSLTSASPYLPHLFVNASARAFDYDIKLQVTGPADNPHMEFSSTPGLSSEQILLMLTTGELPATSTGFSMQQRASRLGMFVGKNILGRFGSSGAGSERLTIRSGESFSEQGRTTYSFDYKFFPDWSVVGEYDRFGGLNIGLKWRFFSE